VNRATQQRIDAIVARHIDTLELLSEYSDPKPRPRRKRKRDPSYPRRVGEIRPEGRGMFDPVLDAVPFAGRR
jgi:hypothetical protein